MPTIVKFDKLINSIEGCNTTSGASQPEERLFVRKLKGPGNVVDGDLQTRYELGKSPCNITDAAEWKTCDLFKGCNSVSVNDFSEEVREEVLKIYKLKFDVSPKYKGGAVIFKLKSNAGLVEHTANNRDPHHYSFYKNDDFAHNADIEVIEFFALKDKCL